MFIRRTCVYTPFSSHEIDHYHSTEENKLKAGGYRLFKIVLLNIKLQCMQPTGQLQNTYGMLCVACSFRKKPGLISSPLHIKHTVTPTSPMTIIHSLLNYRCFRNWWNNWRKGHWYS